MVFGDLLGLNKDKVAPIPDVLEQQSFVDITHLMGDPLPECPQVKTGGDCEPALTWLTIAATKLGWLRVHVVRGIPGNWIYEIVPETELAVRAKGRTWQQLQDLLVTEKDFRLIAKDFEARL